MATPNEVRHSRLILTRRLGEWIVVQTPAGPMRFNVSSIQDTTRQVKICVEAPRDILVLREEVLFAMAAEGEKKSGPTTA